VESTKTHEILFIRVFRITMIRCFLKFPGGLTYRDYPDPGLVKEYNVSLRELFDLELPWREIRGCLLPRNHILVVGGSFRQFVLRMKKFVDTSSYGLSSTENLDISRRSPPPSLL